MKTFATPATSESGNLLAVIHDTRRIGLFLAAAMEVRFEFTAYCGEKHGVEYLNPDGTSCVPSIQRDMDERLRTRVSCKKCGEARR